MRIGLEFAQQRVVWEELERRARLADAAGFDGIWLFDHFKPMYGEGPGNCFEAWTALTALGALTERVRLGVLVTGMTYRHPSVLAAEVVTADHVSNGRVELGLGAAWFDEEHRELGIDFPPTGERVTRFEEYVEVIERLLTGEEVSFDGRYHRLDGARLLPEPVQQPHPPRWIGAGGDRMLAIAGRHADVWHTFSSGDQLRELSGRLDRAAEAAGRDPSDILRASNLSLSEPWNDLRTTAERYAEAGVGYLIASWPEEGHPRVEEFAETILPDLTSLGA